MYDINKISDYISSLDFSFLKDDSFAIHPNWVHSNNIDFLKKLCNEFPGEIKSCEAPGCGFYLIFKN